MASCVPIKELKNTAEFTRMVEEAGEPVIVTKNGSEALVVMTPETYENLRLQESRAELYASLLRGEEDIRQGRTIPAEEVTRQAREKYGLL